MTDVTSHHLPLLIVDDDDRFRERLSRAFGRRGYQVVAFAEGEPALRYAEESTPPLALIDLRLKGEWGLNVVRRLLEINPEARVVVLTAYGSIATAIEAVRLGAQHYLQKPVSVDEIERALMVRPEDRADAESQDEEELAHQGATDEHWSEERGVPSLAAVEWEYINRILTECDGNIRKTAALLGMHRRTLQRKLAKFPERVKLRGDQD